MSKRRFDRLRLLSDQFILALEENEKFLNEVVDACCSDTEEDATETAIQFDESISSDLNSVDETRNLSEDFSSGELTR